jgi:hypothetical protein
MLYRMMHERTKNKFHLNFALCAPYPQEAHTLIKLFCGKKSGAHTQSCQYCLSLRKTIFRPLRGALFRAHNMVFFVTSLPE